MTMNLEKPAGWLSEDDAHKEADMMKAHLRVSSLDDGRFYKRSEGKYVEPTADDYEQAANAIDELRRLAESEPVTVEVLNKIARAGEKSLQAANLVIMGLVALAKQDRLIAGEAFLDLMNSENTRFRDAAKKLRTAEKMGEEVSA